MPALLGRLLRETAWWAPAAVLVRHKLVMRLGLRGQSDGLLHFCGGAAICYFLWTLLPLAAGWLGALSGGWRLALAMTGGWTVALGWDLAEFASDELLGTDVQHSLRETMLDLAYGSAGVLVVAAVLWVGSRRSAPVS